MARTWEGVHRYVPVLVCEDLWEKAQRENAWLEAEADDAEEQRRFCRGMELRRGKHSLAHIERSPQH